MTPADLNTDFSNWSKDQCDEFYKQQFSDAMARNGGDAIKGGSSVAKLFPGLMARKKQLAQEAMQTVANDDAAQRAAIPQLKTDTQGLYANASVEDMSAIWRACGNSFDSAKASVGFDVLVQSFAKNQRLDYPEAERRVRSQFKALAALSDTQKCAAKLGVELPPTSTPGNPQWSSKAGLSAAPVAQKSLGTSYPNKTRTGLNAFQVQGAAPIANEADDDLQNEYLKAFNTPESRAAAINCLTKYLAHEGGISEDAAKKSIPEKAPHMARVFDAHMRDQSQK